MKKSTKKKIKKIWASTKKTAKIAGKEIVAAGKVTRREVAAAGKGLQRIGKGLSASGDVIQESFRPSETPHLPEQQLIPQRKLIPQKKGSYITKMSDGKYLVDNRFIFNTLNEAKNWVKSSRLTKEEFYKPAGYRKNLSFGWGGY